MSLRIIRETYQKGLRLSLKTEAYSLVKGILHYSCRINAFTASIIV